MKSIVVPLIDTNTDQWVVEKAVDAAASLGSHLTALLIEPMGFRFPVYPHYEAMAHHPALMEQFEEAAALRRSKLKAAAKEAAERNALSFADDASTITLAVVEADEWTAVKEAAPVHDVVLFVRKSDDAEPLLPTTELMKDALEYAGRPILVLTDDAPPRLTARVGIAWNGSVEGARAVSAALPLLKQADEVVIFTFATSKTDLDEAPKLGSYLRRHGIEATVVTGEPEASLGESLLAAVEAARITLLVTGGYTHSRLRQAVLGGVTRHMLTHCKIPMLMAH